MKRTIEKLAQERRDKEQRFSKKLEEYQEDRQSLEHLEERLKTSTFPALSKKRDIFAPKAKPSSRNGKNSGTFWRRRSAGQKR